MRGALERKEGRAKERWEGEEDEMARGMKGKRWTAVVLLTRRPL